MDLEEEGTKSDVCGDNSVVYSSYSGSLQNRKVMKHALRQQAKRRRKNTTIASGSSRTLPRIVVKPLLPPPINDSSLPVHNSHLSNTVDVPPATMREVLESLPGFIVKSSRRRSTKKLSAAAQLEAGLVDLESPASILANSSLRVLLNKHTFQGLPPLYQRKLSQLLPAVDRQDAATSGLNNEFFARACIEWRKRLAEGEFTPENQQRLKMEAERDKHKLDPWKLKHFEPIWGDKRELKLQSGFDFPTESKAGGAVTRSSLRLRVEPNDDQIVAESTQTCQIKILEEKRETEDEEEEDEEEDDDDEDEEEEDDEDDDDDEDEEEEDESCIVQEQTTDVLDHENKRTELNHCLTNRNVKVVCLKMKCREKSTLAVLQNIQDVNKIVDSNVDKTQSLIKVLRDHEFYSHHSERSTRVLESSNKFENFQTDVSVEVEKVNELNEKEKLRDKDIVNDGNLQNLEKCKSNIINNEILRISNEPDNKVTTDEVTDLLNKEIYLTSCKSTTPEAQCRKSNHASATTELDAVLDTRRNMDNNHVTEADTETQIPEGMEIDSETLQRIHELEVRGEMKEAYEEISGCAEEIMYPILEGMEISTNNITNNAVTCTTRLEDITEDSNMNVANEEDALREANNYVCSEMLECSWTANETSVRAGRATQEMQDMQVPWPLVEAALDESVPENIVEATRENNDDTTIAIDSTSCINKTQDLLQPQPSQHGQFVDTKVGATDAINCVQLPVASSSQFLNKQIAINDSLVNSIQSHSSPIITFPHLQSIRLVQTNFAPGQISTSHSISNTIAPQVHLAPQNPTPVNVIRSQQEILHIRRSENLLEAVSAEASSTSASNQPPNLTEGSIMIQHQSTAISQPTHQVITAMQAQPQQCQQTAIVQQQFPTVTMTARSARPGQNGSRSLRSGPKELSGSRSRSNIKEPPGAVNLERSYQICQAVIQSSPNRDQLKAHLKPPPSLLAKGDKAFTTNKIGGRTVTTLKAQKTQHITSLYNKHTQNKSVMLRHIFATTRHTTPTELPEKSTGTQINANSCTGSLGQYVLVQRTGVSDSAPRASSAPPLPPHLTTNVGVGVHVVRGRPASAGEGSHQAVALKTQGATGGRGVGGAEPNAPGFILGGDPPPQCECNIRGAMVICRQCGAFCHGDCIGPQLCLLWHRTWKILISPFCFVAFRVLSD